jgi:hypothetical protein
VLDRAYAASENAYLLGTWVKVNSLQRMQTDSAAGLDALFPSVLDKAFKGALLAAQVRYCQVTVKHVTTEEQYAASVHV